MSNNKQPIRMRKKLGNQIFSNAFRVQLNIKLSREQNVHIFRCSREVRCEHFLCVLLLPFVHQLRKIDGCD